MRSIRVNSESESSLSSQIGKKSPSGGRLRNRRAALVEPRPPSLRLFSMNRQKIVTRLKFAERYVAECKSAIARQRAIIADLKSDVYSAASAKRLLRDFLELQSMHEAGRDSLVRRLAHYDRLATGTAVLRSR